MCGRAILVTPPEVLRELFGLFEMPELSPPYNIAPSQPTAIIRSPHKLELARWGIASGASAQAGLRPGLKINIRSESARNNPATRELARSGRCLVVVSGFYEWKREGKARQPFLLTQPDRSPFALGGLWTTTPAASGEDVTCAILTCPAAAPVSDLHDRMPLVIPAEAYDRWIDPRASVTDLFASPAAVSLVTQAVSTHVSSAANDDARCIEPAESASPRQEALFR